MTTTPQRQIMDVLYANQPTSRNFRQNFEYANRIITHEHHVEVQTTPARQAQLQIINHFARVEAGKLFKLTEIHLQNRVIKIIDSISAPSNPMTVSESQDPTSDTLKAANRRQLLPKRFLAGGPPLSRQQGKLRDTKNVVKNIIRIFQGWLQQDWRMNRIVLRELNQMVKTGRYNNNLIIKIASNGLTRRAFLRFSRNIGRDYIEKSKINDKESHLQALGKYENLCVEQEEEHQEMDSNREEENVEASAQLDVEAENVKVQQ